jgi:hypothetical protein
MVILNYCEIAGDGISWAVGFKAGSLNIDHYHFAD